MRNRKIASVLPLLLGLSAFACATSSNETKGDSMPDAVWLETEERGVVPAGTEIAIRSSQEIDSDKEVINRSFPGTMMQDIRSRSGEIMVPKGSPVELTVVQVSDAGALGTAEMSLAVRSITAHGRTYAIRSEEEMQRGREGIGANPRTGIFTGGGAAIGGVIGAIAGGTSGAILGGVLGGVAGAATQVLTRGDRVKVPGGTILTFKLEQPWYLDIQKPEERKQPEPSAEPVS